MLETLRSGRLFGVESHGPTAVVRCDIHGHEVITERLVLRRPTRRDLKALVRLLDTEAFVNNGIAETPAARAAWARAISAGPPGQFCADHRQTGELVASWNLSLGEQDRWELGGTVDAAFRGQGYGREIVKGLLAVGDHRRVGEVFAATRLTNVACRKALRAAGMTEIGIAPHVLPDGSRVLTAWHRALAGSDHDPCRAGR